MRVSVYIYMFMCDVPGVYREQVRCQNQSEESTQQQEQPICQFTCLFCLVSLINISNKRNTGTLRIYSVPTGPGMQDTADIKRISFALTITIEFRVYSVFSGIMYDTHVLMATLSVNHRRAVAHASSNHFILLAERFFT